MLPLLRLLLAPLPSEIPAFVDNNIEWEEDKEEAGWLTGWPARRPAGRLAGWCKLMWPMADGEQRPLRLHRSPKRKNVNNVNTGVKTIASALLPSLTSPISPLLFLLPRASQANSKRNLHRMVLVFGVRQRWQLFSSLSGNFGGFVPSQPSCSLCMRGCGLGRLRRPVWVPLYA